MVVSNDARSAELAIVISYPTSASGIIVLLKTLTKYREFFPTLFVKTTDFQLVFNFEQTRTYHIRRAWYNGSYTMTAKPIRGLELHYPMIQFLIKINISCFAFLCIKNTETIFTVFSAYNKQSLCYYWSISTLPSLRCQILSSKVCRHGFLQRLPKASPCHQNLAKSIPVERHYCISKFH